MTKDVRTAYPLIAHELDDQDPSTQQHRTLLEFLRTWSIGKLIAIVGSGSSIVYGYDSWDDFIEQLAAKLIEFASHKDSHRLMKPSGKKICRTILSKPNSGLKPYEKLNVCDAVVECLETEGHTALQEQLVAWFRRREAYRWRHFNETRPLRKLKGDLWIASSEGIRSATSLRANPQLRGIKQNEHLPPDLSKMLELLPIDRPVFRELRGNKKQTLIPATYDERIAAARNLCDPLRVLRSRLNIRRFATFNYDLEIESLLEDQDYPYNSLTDDKNHDPHLISESRIGGTARSISLSPRNAAELIALAAIPSTANDLIVHIHGAITRPDEMVVTQSNYNRLYFERYQNRLAFEDAQNLMFGGNAVIFVGFGMNEEDLMRPLRYLSANLKNRPLYALMPQYETEEKAKALAHKIKSNYGVNVVIYGLSKASIDQLHVVRAANGKRIKHPLETTTPDFISLGEELENIRKVVESHGSFGGLLNPRLIPRLRHYPAYRIILDYLVGQNKKKPCLDKDKRKVFSAFLQSIAISTALNQALEYFQDTVRLWHNGFSIDHEASHPHHPPLGSKQIGADRDDYGRVKLPPHHLPENRIRNRRHGAPAAPRVGQINSLYEKIKDKQVAVLRFSPGAGKGSFVSQVRSLEKAHNPKDSRKIRIISIDHSLRAKMVLIDVIRNLGSTRLLCLNNADHLLDLKAERPKNIFTLKFLNALKDELGRPQPIKAEEESKKELNAKGSGGAKSSEEKGIRILLLTHSESAYRTYVEFFGCHAQSIEDGDGANAGILPLTVEKAYSNYLKGADTLNHVLQHSRWSNILLENVLASPLFGDDEAKRDFCIRCNSRLDSKTFGVDKKYQRSVFCGIVLEQVQNVAEYAADENQRKLIVVQNVILKWMHAITFAVDDRTIKRIPEIRRLIENPDKSSNRYSFKGRIFKGDVVKTAIQQLQVYGLIYALDLPPGHPERYVLHGAVRQYLSHRRGLSLEEASARDWQSVTLPLTLTDSAPMPSEEDYAATIELFNEFVRGNASSTSAHGLTSFWNYPVEDRIVLRSAYAVLKNGLNLQIAMRAGLVYPDQSPKPSRSVLSRYLGQLARLRSAALADDLSTGNHSDNKRKDNHTSSTAVIYWQDKVWLLNEMGVVRFLQGNVHDAVMIFRRIIASIESESSDKRWLSDQKGGSHDPMLLPRLSINLALALIERARFIDAENTLNRVFSLLRDLETEDRLAEDEANRDQKAAGNSTAQSESLKNKQPPKQDSKQFLYCENPEFRLIKALALACKAQIDLLTARVESAQSCITRALDLLADAHPLAARAWLHHVRSDIALASHDFVNARKQRTLALAAARGAQRPDLILSFEVAEIEYDLRNAGFSRESVLSALSRLKELESTATALGSYKVRAGILLIRARALLTIEQAESARQAVIDAISLAQSNGLRLRRMHGLVLLVAVMAMRGEREPAKKLLASVKLAATRSRYVRAVVEIEALEQSIDIDGGIPSWAGFVSDFTRASQSHLPKK
ncbi:MAG: SIR2 family protein [Lysobacteraceae bacterium]|nr:MAG: SIR2 family protein [Xanthomonadaceae bacterium]